MSDIEFSKDDKEHITRLLRTYCEDELDMELGNFDAQFLFEFITKNIGPYFYNRGLLDARAVFEKRIEQVMDSIYEIEKPLPS